MVVVRAEEVDGEGQRDLPGGVIVVPGQDRVGAVHEGQHGVRPVGSCTPRGQEGQQDNEERCPPEPPPLRGPQPSGTPHCSPLLPPNTLDTATVGLSFQEAQPGCPPGLPDQPSRRNGRYDVRSTAEGCGRSSRAQIAVFSTARCLPTVHRSKASPRANERSAALIDGDAFASGTAPSRSGSSSGLIRKTPSLVRTPAKRPCWNVKTAEGATSEIANPFGLAPSQDGTGVLARTRRTESSGYDS